MENATKALLIAGGVLIAIIMLSVGVALYSIYSNQAKEYDQIVSDTEIQKFNSKFIIYIGRTDITPQEVASAVNLAREYNDQIIVNIKNKSGDKMNFPNSESFISSNLNAEFTCQNTGCTYDETGKIKEITFKENS